MGYSPTEMAPSWTSVVGVDRSACANAPLRTSSTSFTVKTASPARIVLSAAESSSVLFVSSLLATSSEMAGVSSGEVRETLARDALVVSSATTEAADCSR
jgi:hypothetical protein